MRHHNVNRQIKSNGFLNPQGKVLVCTSERVIHLTAEIRDLLTRIKSVCTTRSLVKPVIRHLTNAVEMNKGCDHHQHMEDLMALELKEWNRRNVYLIE